MLLEVTCLTLQTSFVITVIIGRVMETHLEITIAFILKWLPF